MKSLELNRAEFAAKKAKGQNEDYKNAIKKMIPLVQSGGIIAALAFAKAKEDKMEKVYNDLVEWLIMRGKIPSEKNRAILELVEMDSLQILQITKETMAVLSWMKRMADSLITKEHGKKEKA